MNVRKQPFRRRGYYYVAILENHRPVGIEKGHLYDINRNNFIIQIYWELCMLKNNSYSIRINPLNLINYYIRNNATVAQLVEQIIRND